MILPVLLLLAADRAIGRGSAASDESVKEAAGSVVRSREWVVRRGEKREEEFVGDVHYDAAGTHLSADWALYRHAAKEWTARGKVRLRKELAGGDLVEAAGERARYDEKTRTGELLPEPGGLVSFARTPAGEEPDRGSGLRLDWEGDTAATLTGSARVWGPRLEVWADSARWTRLDRRLALRGGRPVLRKVDAEGGWTTALKADEVDATQDPRRIEARGRVKGWLKFKDQDRKLKELQKR